MLRCPFRLLIAAACLIAQLALVGVALWHHHEDTAEHGGCAVCVAALAEKMAGAPPVAAAQAAVQLCGTVALLEEQDASVAALRVHRARGPPSMV